jgi:hypothetical protein
VNADIILPAQPVWAACKNLPTVLIYTLLCCSPPMRSLLAHPVPRAASSLASASERHCCAGAARKRTCNATTRCIMHDLGSILVQDSGRQFT